MKSNNLIKSIAIVLVLFLAIFGMYFLFTKTINFLECKKQGIQLYKKKYNYEINSNSNNSYINENVECFKINF
jgi:uncharacterized protein YpmB